MEVYRRSSGLLLLLGLSLLATTLQGVQGEVEAEGPSESECRPYIEKALKELEAGELAVGSSAELGESKEDIPTVEITDDSDHEEGDGEKHDINEDGQESKENEIVSEKKSDPEQDDASPVRGDQPAVDVEDSKEIETDNNDKQDYSKETGDEQEEAAQKEDSDSKEETDKEDDSKEVLDNKDDSTEEPIRTKREIDTEDDTKEDQDDDATDEQDDDRKDEQEDGIKHEQDDDDNNTKEEHDNGTKEEQDEESKENGDIQAESKEEAVHESENIQTVSVEELVEKVEAESLTESLDQADDDSKEDGKSLEADDQKGDDNDSIEQAEDQKDVDKDSKEEESQGHNLQPETTEDEEEDTKDNSKHEENADEDSQEDRKDDDVKADDDNKDDDNDGKDDDATDNDTKQDETKDDDIQDDPKENEMVDTNEIKEDSKEAKEDKIDEQSEDNTVDQESQEDTKDSEDSKDDEATQTVNDDKIDEDTKEDPQSSKEGDRNDDQAESNEDKNDKSDGNEKKDLEVENSDEKHDQSIEDGGPVEDLSLDTEIPTDLRDRRHVEQLLKLDDDHSESEELINRVSEITLRDLKKLYENAIKPLETVYKYRDLSNRHFGDSEIFSKPLILFMGPWSGGKSSIINYLTNNEYNDTSLRTGAEPSPAYFNILMYGEEPEVIDGAELAADFTFSGLQKFGQGLEERLRGVKIPSKLLERVNIVEIPGILEVRKQVSRVFPFNDACQWFIDRGDIIFLVYDPSKLDVGPETEAILDQLKGREHQTRIILNKADQVKPEELMRVQGALIWNISPLMSSPQPPIMYTTSLWSRPYEPWAPVRLLQAQERAFLRDLRGAVDKRIENKIASARRFAVRVRNHAKMVDCYLTTYYNHKSVFGNRKQVADAIIEHPQDYHIYEGLSTLTNISRYDLPDPDVYRDFFKLNPLYEFQQLSATCTYFRGCPINRLDIAIAYDLPELLGTHKKRIENALAEAGTGSQQTSAPGS